MKAAKRLLAVLIVAAAALAGVVVLRDRGPDHILLSGATARPLEGTPGAVAVFVTIENAGEPDRIVGASSPDAAAAVLVAPSADTGLPIPAGGRPSLAADGAYLKLTGITGDLGDGRLIPVTLKFAEAGAVTTRARLADPQAQGNAASVGLFGLGDICVVGGDTGEPAPAISLNVQADGDGWTVQVVTEQFSFTEDLVDGPHIPGTGHGHLYLGGVKLQRLYDPVARIGALPPGTHEVQVTLNTNDHRAYVVGETPVTASATIEVR